MTAQSPANNTPIPIRQFNAVKQIQFFESLKQPRFSGQLLLTDTKGKTWTFYLYLGRLMYASGGYHPIRRWRRNLADFCPQRLTDIPLLQSDLGTVASEEIRTCWEYQLLSLWIDQQKITREQANSIIRATIVEIIFDITQAMEVTCELKQDNLLSTRLVLVESEQVIGEAEKLWQVWQGAKIADRSPNMSPVIRQAEQLQQRTSPQVYKNLSQLLDGEQSLRDLAVRMKRDVLTVTRSLLPYIQLGLVQLAEIPDLPSPFAQAITGSFNPNKELASNTLIACIDDSPLSCQTMEKIITSAGYQFVGITDAVRAIAILLSRKPHLIFLDLVMPNANGYEICNQLRKLSVFRETPIIILTGNDGIVDRFRAKMVGANDFVSKPINSATVLGIVQKYLKQESPKS